MATSYRFGPFTVDAASYRLLREDEVVPLSPKIIDLLLYLVARQSTLVSKDELFGALWPDVAVTDNALTQAVSELRQALGDDPAQPTYIQTVARRGYRFIATVEAVSPHTDSATVLPVQRAADTHAPVLDDPVGGPIDEEWAEAVGGGRHREHCNNIAFRPDGSC